MPVLTSEQKALLRTHPHTSMHYLAILDPTRIVSSKFGGGTNIGAVFQARVKSVVTDADTAVVTAIEYQSATGQYQDAGQHFTMLTVPLMEHKARGGCVCERTPMLRTFT
jgi:hypothetical protein